MKQKCTIMVDADLLPKAKRYARSRGLSLSALIEQSLRQKAGETAPSFASRWQGRPPADSLAAGAEQWDVGQGW